MVMLADARQTRLFVPAESVSFKLASQNEVIRSEVWGWHCWRYLETSGRHSGVAVIDKVADVEVFGPPNDVTSRYHASCCVGDVS